MSPPARPATLASPTDWLSLAQPPSPIGLGGVPGAGVGQAAMGPRASHPYPLLTPSGRAISVGGRVQNVSSDPLAPCIMYWPDNEPLPEQGQIRPSGSAVITVSSPSCSLRCTSSCSFFAR